MATTAIAVLALGGGVAACGSDDDDGGGGSGGGGDSGKSAKIALLLPETKTARYESQDRPNFERKVKELCSNCEIIYSNADQDPAKQLSQVEAAITKQVDVMVLDPVDSASAAGMVAKAKAAEHPGHLVRPPDHRRAGPRLLHLVRQREGRRAAGPGARRQAQGGRQDRRRSS